MGTVARADDTIAAFSSRGPGAVDYGAKPDVVAPGVGIVSLSDPNSAFYASKSAYLLEGTAATSYLPYLSLSGTSMATPVVSGTVALMLQANPALTPNHVKALLQYTAQTDRDYNPLVQGTGFLNAQGAVEFARFFAAPSGTPYPHSNEWSARLIWGNQRIGGGRLTPDANAWSTTVTWGAATAAGGQTVEWGVICLTADCDSGGGTWHRWGAICSNSTCSDVRWGQGSSENVVWRSTCGGADCETPWRIGVTGYVLSPGTEDTAVVWGTDGDGAVTGTSCSDASCEPVIWDH
jgi:hypothetical protein